MEVADSPLEEDGFELPVPLAKASGSLRRTGSTAKANRAVSRASTILSGPRFRIPIAMLRQPEGATVDEVASVIGWQRHTVRGVFSGTLKKKLGLTLASAQEERGRVYRIAEPASV